MRINKFLYPVIGLCIWTACNNNKVNDDLRANANSLSFSVSEFHALTNFQNQTDEKLKQLNIDFNHAIDSGITIPTSAQVKNGLFEFSFQIKNTGNQPKACFYKLYYQNEQYKFSEMDSATGQYNPLCLENFYGSYHDSILTFNKTKVLEPGEEIQIHDYLRITGNPRCEPQFYSNGRNDRWKRNPRVGRYKFMLVTTEEATIRDHIIPEAVQNICLKENDSYINPFHYFLYGKGKSHETTTVSVAPEQLKVTAKLNFANGIFADTSSFRDMDTPPDSGCNCDTSEAYRKNAHIAQFIHSVSKQNTYENIPLIMDVINEGYSKRAYNYNSVFTKRNETIKTFTSVAKNPCKTVSLDTVTNHIILKNPASTYGNWKKESVGIITRHGLTYGKWRAKVKLTQLLNKDNVWNGLTNAIWLIVQPDKGDWNRRRICNGEGYMRDYGSGRGDPRANIISYSEIDFEILKTASYCPDMTFPPVYKNPVPDRNNSLKWDVEMPDDVKQHDGDIMVACTNWDMACADVKRFGVGCNSFDWNGRTFYTHRWDNWYNALTEKSPHSDDELFAGEYYWFEIEWTPKEIIWRIGPEKNQLQIVGYMNDEITSVPNNQMLMVITQEWHNSRWWPGSPYLQENIPFPKNDIKGEILEIEID